MSFKNECKYAYVTLMATCIFYFSIAMENFKVSKKDHQKARKIVAIDPQGIPVVLA